SDAVRAFGLLACRVGPDRDSLPDDPGVDDHVTGRGDLGREVVHPTWRRTALLLADPVVLRTVATAFEPLARGALRDAAPEMRALLVGGDDPGPDGGHQLGLVGGLGLGD